MEVGKINKAVKNFFLIGSSNIISQLLTFFLGVYYARVLGRNAFGDINIVQPIMVYFTLITLFGLQTFGTREVSKHGENTSGIVGEILTFRFIVSIFCYILIIILAVCMNKGTSFKILMLLYGLTIFPASLNIDWLFMGLQDMKYNAVYNIIKIAVPFVLVLIFIKNSKDLYLIPIFTVIGLIFGLIYQLYSYKISLKFRLRPNLDIEKAKKYFIYGLPFLMSGLLAMINCNVDKIIIGFSRSNTENGVYSAAYYIILFLTNIVTIIFTPIFPLLTSYFNEKATSKLKKLIESVSKVIILFDIPLTFGGSILSKEIILLLFGKEYIGAYVPLRILMIYILLLFIREIYGYSLNAWNMEKKYLYIVAASSLINLVFNLILTPYYGMNVAAWITVFSEVINLVFMKYYANKVVKLNLLKHLASVAIPTLIMSLGVVLLRYLNINIIINIVVAMVTYSISILTFKYVTVDEIKELMLKKNGG